MDGLSLDRHRSLERKLLNQQLSFTKSFEQSLIFRKALSRVIEIVGKLHVAFHMCQCIYTIYAPLLKIIQKLLNWKKMKFNNVSDSFRLCKSMLILCLEEGERLAWDFFLNDKQNKIKEAMTKYKDDATYYSCWLSKNFSSYLHEVIHKSTDQRRKYLVSFVLSVRWFLLFWKAVRNGDALFQEYVCIEFLGVYYLLHKRNYVELALDSMEREYSIISYVELHDIRVNSSIWYKKDGKSVHMDEMQENLNQLGKKFILVGDAETWLKHSAHVVVGRKCISFADGEYRRQELYYDDKDQGVKLNERRSYHTHDVTPKLERERVVVYEFFVKFFGEEVDGRLYNNVEAWNISRSLDTKINKDDPKDEVKDDSSPTDIDVFRESINRDDDDTNIQDEDILDKVPEQVSGESPDDQGCDDENMNTGQHLKGVHKYALSNIFKLGEELLTTKCFWSIRRNRRSRHRRIKQFLTNLYDKVINRTCDLGEKVNTIKTEGFVEANFRKQEYLSNHTLDDMIKCAMKSIWNKEPRVFQNVTIKKLIKMKNKTNECMPILLVHGTGGGKSAVMQTVATINLGVTLAIENTLSLSVDQSSKISGAQQKYGSVIAFHLDLIKRKKDYIMLINTLLDLKPDTEKTIILFSSPEVLLKGHWKIMLGKLIEKGLLRLVCVDEVHQFVHFGTSFRYEFSYLRHSLFNKLLLDDKLQVPLLFMTATFNEGLKVLLQKMTGLTIGSQNYVWSKKEGFDKRHINMIVSTTTQYKKVMKDNVNDVLSMDWRNKVIIYTSTAKETNYLKEEIDFWLDEEDSLKGDSLAMYGEQEAEVKQATIEEFTKIFQSEGDLSDDTLIARILVATSGCIGAGLDS